MWWYLVIFKPAALLHGPLLLCKFRFSINGCEIILYCTSTAAPWSEIVCQPTKNEASVPLYSFNKRALRSPKMAWTRTHHPVRSDHRIEPSISQQRSQECYFNQLAATLPPTPAVVYSSQHPRFREKTNRQHWHHVQCQQPERTRIAINIDNFWRKISRSTVTQLKWREEPRLDHYPTPRRRICGKMEVDDTLNAHIDHSIGKANTLNPQNVRWD